MNAADILIARYPLTPATRGSLEGKATPGKGIWRGLKLRTETDAAAVLELIARGCDSIDVYACFEHGPIGDGPYRDSSRLLTGLPYVDSLVRRAQKKVRDQAAAKLALICENFTVSNLLKLRGQYTTVTLTITPKQGRPFRTTLTLPQIAANKGDYFKRLCYALGYFHPVFDMAKFLEYLMVAAEETTMTAWSSAQIQRELMKILKGAVKEEREAEGLMAWYDARTKRVHVRPDFLMNELALRDGLTLDPVALLSALRDMCIEEREQGLGQPSNTPSSARERVWAVPAPVIGYKPKGVRRHRNIGNQFAVRPPSPDRSKEGVARNDA